MGLTSQKQQLAYLVLISLLWERKKILFHLASSECRLAFYYKVCIRLFYLVVLGGWIPLSFPSCLFCFPVLQMLLCVLTIALLSLAADELTAATAAHVLCAGGFGTVNPNQLFMKEPICRLASTSIQHPARPPTGWIVQSLSPYHLPWRLFAPLIVCRHKVNDTIVLPRLWRAEAVCRTAKKEHQFTSNLQLWWTMSTTFSDFFFISVILIHMCINVLLLISWPLERFAS